MRDAAQLTDSSFRYLKYTLDLAEECFSLGNPPFGAVLVRADGVVAIGSNVTISSGNPLRHAELEALFAYYAERGRPRGEVKDDLVMFCSTEPCLMCMGALY